MSVGSGSGQPRPRDRQSGESRREVEDGAPRVGGRWNGEDVCTLIRPGSTRTACALLWDLDNVAPGHQHLAALAEALSSLAGPDALCVAAGRRAMFRTARVLLAQSGIEIVSGGRRRDGADKVLIARARLMSRADVGTFVVASNDGRFARVAGLGELHVVTLDVSQVSLRLLSAATAVTQFVASGDRWHLEPLMHRRDCR